VGERPKRKLTEEMVQKIQAHLDENEEKKKKGQRKQLKKPMDVYEALQAENFDISYSTVLRTFVTQVVMKSFNRGGGCAGCVTTFSWLPFMAI